MTAGPNGTVWFTESTAGKLGVVNVTTNAITEFSLPGSGSTSSPYGITTGTDGNVWFADSGTNTVGMINPTTHAISEYTVPTSNATPYGITNGPDGNLWFTEQKVGKIGFINPTTHAITEFTVPTANSDPSDITVGPDGNLWFTEENTNKIASINPTTHVFTEYTIPTTNTQPFSITKGSDGNLWFTSLKYNQIEMFNPTTHAFSAVSVPTANSDPIDIAAGPDGNLYFTELKANQIAKLNPATHTITEFAVPTTKSEPYGITAGPDQNVWFTESLTSKIGLDTLGMHLVVTSSPPANVTPGTGFGVTVAVEDASNVIEGNYSGQLTVALASNPGSSTLGGTLTVTANSGVATFSGLTLNQLGNGYTLQVSATGLSPITTSAFNVVPVTYPTAVDLGFQSPYLGTGATAYATDPTGSAWTFTGSAGEAGNGSAYTSGNPSAPVGTQVGFIQMGGAISQSLTLAAGSYSLSLAVAQRGNYQSSSQTIEVLIDGTSVGTFSPSGTSYTIFTTNNFTATAGSHTLTLLGLNPNGGDNTAFVDELALGIANSVQDGGFETPSVGAGPTSYQIDPTGTPWVYTGAAGVSGNNSAYTSGNPSAPAGTQVGIVQQTGRMSQTLTLAAGTYTVSFAAAQRANFQSSSQTVGVLFDGTAIEWFTPSGTSYANFTTANITATAGTHTVTLVGLNPNGGDNTAFIDQFVVGIANSAQDGSFEVPNVGVGPTAYQLDPLGSPWTYTGTAGVAGNGSAFTSGNPAAPWGTQVGVIQQTGSISQTVNLSAGTYTVSLFAAQRGNYQASSQTFEVVVDSEVVGIFTPAGSSYTAVTTGPFTVTAGNHTLKLIGMNPNGGDNTAFVDQVVINQPGLENTAYLQDPVFASPGVGVGTSAYQAAPAGSPWTFTGSAGVTGNSSAFTSGNPPAPSGTQVAYIQGTGQISQSVSLGAGTYDLTLTAAQRGNYETSSQTFQVVVGTTVVGIFDPSGSGYTSLTTGPITVSAGTYAIKLIGLNPNGGDNTVFISQLAINPVTPQAQPTVKDPNFQSPGVGVGANAYQFSPAGSPWTFSGSSGLTGNGSAFTSGNPSAPVGTQVAFIQGTAHISQSFTLAAGTYKVSFAAAQRGNYQTSSQTVGVIIDGTAIDWLTPSSTSYTTQTTLSFTVSTSGTHTLAFAGLNPNGGDNTVFIGQVLITAV